MILHKKSYPKGFTLIEVLIVVVIIAALAAMVIPRFVGQVGRAQAAEAFNILGVIRKALANTFAIEREICPNGDGCYYSAGPGNAGTGWEKYGIKNPVGLKTYYVDLIIDAMDEYYLSVNDGGENGIDLNANLQTGTETWNCTGEIFRNKVAGNTNTPCVLK